METWKDFKQSVNSISGEKMTVTDTLSYLQAERIRRGIRQREFAEKIGTK